jgi:hypothetical protein
VEGFEREVKMMSFSSMAKLNKFALVFLVLAKFFGLIGVSMGFISQYHSLGGYFLTAAFVAIVTSIFCVILQTSRDKKIFSIEDEEKKRIKSFKEMKKDLEEEIRLLEAKKNALMSLEVRRGKL